jgi:ABC-type transporter Mla MlaB component
VPAVSGIDAAGILTHSRLSSASSIVVRMEDTSLVKCLGDAYPCGPCKLQNRIEGRAAWHESAIHMRPSKSGLESSHAMLRISFIESADHSVALRLEGQIVGPWVEELRNSCERVLTQGKRLTLDFADLSFVDREGIALLRALAERRVEFANCSRFVAELLKELPL